MGAIHQVMFMRGGGGGGGGTPGVATSIIFADGANHNAAADDKWDSDNPTIATAETGAHGRCYDHSSVRVRRAISPTLQTLSAGVRFKMRDDVSDNIIRFMDTTSTVQVALRRNAGGAFEINRGNGPTQLDVSAGGLVSTGSWYYAEMAATIHGSSGSMTGKVYDDSGTLLDTLTFSGDTQETANAFANILDIGSINGNSFTQHAWLDNTGALYGPLRVETLYPNGDGALTQWGRGGADSGADWSQVDEAQNNDSTDYLFGNSAGQIALCTFQDRALTGAIHAVQVSPVLTRAASVGGVQFRCVVRIGGVDYVGTTITNPSNAWVTRPHCWGVSPATGLAWTDSELASAQFGLEAVATPVAVWCTQIVVEVVTAI